VTAPDRLVAGRYRLQRQIGGGGMGTVWLARDERLGRDVALKQVVPPPGADEATIRQQRERAMREGRIAARLSHPHAISVYDVAVEHDQPWLVMEYLPSRSLAAVISEDGLLRVDQAAQIGAQVADALAATHAAGIVHRDVKPANVLIGQGGRVDGYVKITDFGISHAIGDVTLTQTGQITGTPAFLAPEVAQGYDPGPAADVFSLGATLYTCLEGEPPFGMAGNSLQQLHRVAAGVINPPNRSGAMTRSLLAMLSVDPQARPSMSEVRDDLAAIAAGRGGDTTAVLLSPTDVARTSPQPTWLPPFPPGRTPPATPAPPVAPPRPQVQDPPAARQPTQQQPRIAQPVAAAAPAGETSGRRRSRVPWVVAAVILLLAGLGVVLALNLSDPPVDDTASPQTPSTSEPAEETTAAPSTDAGTENTPTTTAEQPPDDADDEGEDEDEETAFGLGADDAEEYLDAYHELVFDDPDAAYAQAGPTLQNAISLEGFRGFWDDFEDVSISDVRLEEGGQSALAVMEFEFPDGTSQIEEHRFTFVEQDGQTVIDSDRFVRPIQGRG
jgi:serine/threonine protein kinase